MPGIIEATILTQNLGTLSLIIQDVALFMGVCFIFGALFEFKKYGEQRTMMSSQHSVMGPLAMLIAGAALLILPKFIGAALLAVWGTKSPLSYDNGMDYGSLMPPILMAVRIIGVIAFIRGIMMLAKSGGQQQQQGTVGKAIMHIIAGVLCVHILGTVGLIESFFGMTGV